jgi:hypothetical protein
MGGTMLGAAQPGAMQKTPAMQAGGGGMSEAVTHMAEPQQMGGMQQRSDQQMDTGLAQPSMLQQAQPGQAVGGVPGAKGPDQPMDPALNQAQLQGVGNAAPAAPQGPVDASFAAQAKAQGMQLPGQQPGVAQSGAAYPGGPAAANGYGQGTPSGTPGAPNSAQGPTINNEQTGNFNTNYIDPAKSAVHEIAGGPAYDAQVRDAYYNEQKAMLDPQWQQRQSDTENQLANMGLSRGSPAWEREKARLDQSQQQAYGSAQNQAIMAGGAESTRLQNAEIARGNFANQAGQQDYQNQVTSQQAQNAGNTAQQQAAQGWQGFRTSEKNATTGANAQVAAAGMNASAAQANAQASQATARELGQMQYQAQQRQMENAERQAVFDRALTLEHDPVKLQNEQMAGMYPTGNPQFSNYQGGSIPGANQANYAEQINQGNSQANAGLGTTIQAGMSLGGRLLNQPQGQFNPYLNTGESVSGGYG